MFSTLVVTVDITLAFIMMTATAMMTTATTMMTATSVKTDKEKIVFFSSWSICDGFHLSRFFCFFFFASYSADKQQANNKSNEQLHFVF